MILNIQVLRIFAAMMVVLFHVIGTSQSYGFSLQVLRIFEGWGQFGVDVFFVISGFVMFYTQARTRQTPLEFIRARLIRIVPLYWFLTFGLGFLFFFVPDVFRDLNISLERFLSSLFFISMLLQDYGPVLYVGWTLEWEMFYYLVFSIALLMRSFRMSVLFIFAVIVFTASFFSSGILIEFLFGMLAAWMHSKNCFSKIHSFIFFLFGFIFLCGGIFFDIEELGIDRVIVWGLPGFLVVLGAVGMPQLKNQRWHIAGGCSYSVYLIQVFTIPVFYKICARFSVDIGGDVLGVLCLVFTFLIGLGTHLFVEKPLSSTVKTVFR